MPEVGFSLTLFSHQRLESTILSLYAEMRARGLRCSGVFYGCVLLRRGSDGAIGK